ncbi:MAG: acyl-CoA synthetase [Gammaproteobacteria bacterium]|nr:acyl-CoA synthetase [Gammaproteobacteria bacterium]
MTLNLGAINDAVANAVPQREAIVFRDKRITYFELQQRTRRLANYLLRCDLGFNTPRSELQPWQSGQDHVGIYLYNGNEYLEGMLGAIKARAVPFNVNYRYVDEELIYLLNDAKAKALIFHSSLAHRVEAIRGQVPTLSVFLQVQDSDDPLIPDAVNYENALAASPDHQPSVDLSEDDLYMLYTGGTTGMPKGVLWRQFDILIAALGGRRTNNTILSSIDEFVQRAIPMDRRSLPAPPFMHGAGHWNAFQMLNSGGTVVIQNNVRKFDALDAINTIERENVSNLLLVGDAFGRPLVDQLAYAPRALPTLRNIITGGAIMTAKVKEELIEQLPSLNIIDTAGSSETGGQGSHVSSAKTGISTGQFTLTAENAILSEDLTKVLEPGHDGLGWWARSGNIPLGYLDDEEKTKKTFATVEGTRYSIPGDRVRLLADGSLELHGRDSVTINSGGEKIFAEEVEQAIKHHPDVLDAVVTGRKSERWGNEVIGIVQLRTNAAQDTDDLLKTCGEHIARYKFPKDFIFVEEVLRSPSGKADYKWAKQIADPDSPSAG